MTESKDLLTYDDLEDLLALNECDTFASEFHGILIGFASAGLASSETGWRQPILDAIHNGETFNEFDLIKIDKFLLALDSKLHNELFEIDLLVPGNNCSIQEQLEGICLWCQGFLLGYGMKGALPSGINDDLQEALNDVAEISQVDLEVDEDDESEAALETVYQHVKVSFQVIFLETQQLNKDIKVTHNPPKNLH